MQNRDVRTRKNISTPNKHCHELYSMWLQAMDLDRWPDLLNTYNCGGIRDQSHEIRMDCFLLRMTCFYGSGFVYTFSTVCVTFVEEE
jgi:hypothetical protein